MYINNIKIFVKNQKELEFLAKTFRIFNEDIEVEFRLWKIRNSDKEKKKKEKRLK